MPIDQLNDDITFNILLIVKNNVTLILTLNGEEDKGSNTEGFPTWAIIVIAIVGILILAIIIFIIILRAKRDNVDANSIENSKLLDSELE